MHRPVRRSDCGLRKMWKDKLWSVVNVKSQHMLETNEGREVQNKK